MSGLVIQKDAKAGRDLAGRDIIKTEHHYPHKPGIVEQLVSLLEKEIESEKSSSTVIETLQNFYTKKAHDGIQGLEAKLTHAQRVHEIELAMEKKEMFSKLLERYALYESAQKIFAHLLSRADHEFTANMLPEIGNLSEVQLNTLITTRVVNPTVEDCGVGLLMMTHGTAMGMFYWLAEQCFVRWHK